MRTFQRTCAALGALLLIAPAATAIDILPSLLDYTSDAKRVPGTPLIEFDRDDWAAFLVGDAAEHPLPELATVVGVPAFDVELAGGPVVTQVWERP